MRVTKERRRIEREREDRQEESGQKEEKGKGYAGRDDARGRAVMLVGGSVVQFMPLTRTRAERYRRVESACIRAELVSKRAYAWRTDYVSRCTCANACDCEPGATCSDFDEFPFISLFWVFYDESLFPKIFPFLRASVRPPPAGHTGTACPK